MRTVFGSWKYLFKNILFLWPFALIPAVFFSLTLDYQCIHAVSSGFFSGAPQAEFLQYFHAWSFFRFDSGTGALTSILTVVVTVPAFALLLCFVEKHMRLGKRTLSGLWYQTKNLLPSATAYAFIMIVVYELWAVVLSSLLFALAELNSTPAIYVLTLLAIPVFGFVLLYLTTVLYLWLPCRQMTGFRFFEALLYSYRLMVGVRAKLLFSFALSALTGLVLLSTCALLPDVVFHIIAIVLCFFLFLHFGVNMEALYFETDKLDREDILRHKWEY